MAVLGNLTWLVCQAAKQMEEPQSRRETIYMLPQACPGIGRNRRECDCATSSNRWMDSWILKGGPSPLLAAYSSALSAAAVRLRLD